MKDRTEDIWTLPSARVWEAETLQRLLGAATYAAILAERQLRQRVDQQRATHTRMVRQQRTAERRLSYRVAETDRARDVAQIEHAQCTMQATVVTLDRLAAQLAACPPLPIPDVLPLPQADVVVDAGTIAGAEDMEADI